MIVLTIIIIIIITITIIMMTIVTINNDINISPIGINRNSKNVFYQIVKYQF